eukprot:1249192-Rhodomonas_salina.1
MADLCSAIRTGRDEYKELLEDMCSQGIEPPPSAQALSSMNVFELIELNTAPRFEKAVLLMTEDKRLDCGALYFRSDADSLELSDLPFSSPLCSADECALSHLSTVSNGTIPIFSLNPAHNLPSPPMSSLPNAPVLSVPQYLDGIQGTLDLYDPTLRTWFESLLTKYALDVFPDPPKLKLGPSSP